MLFDENFGFFTYDLNNNNDNNLNNEKYNIVNSNEGFLKGNMIKNEYKPYKNYTYRKLSTSSKKEALLLEIMELCFAINDLNLLLDLNPDDEKLNKLFKDYVVKSYEKQLEYVNNYGPLEVKETNGKNFDWIKSPWPWDDEDGVKYV